MDELEDLKKLGISFVVSLVVLQLLFNKEEFIVVVRTSATFFWVLVLPGFGITYLWELAFKERFALSVALSAAIVGIFSYYLGLLGVHVKTSAYLLPALSMIAGMWIWKNRKRLKAS